MSSGGGEHGEGFELDAPSPAPARESVPAAPMPSTEGFLEGGAAADAEAGGAPLSEDGVDTRTVSERAGTAVAAEVRANAPAGYPQEMLGYPFRMPGPLVLASIAGGFLALDLLGYYDSMRFMTWFIKGMAVVALVRLQMVLISDSAAGHDTAKGWHRALDMSGDAWSRLGFLLIWFLGPALLVLCLYVWAWQHWVLLLLLLVSMVALPLATLASALGDRSILWPWKAAPWLGRGWMEFLIAAGAWAFLVGAEWVMGHQQEASQLMILLVGLGLRVMTAAAWLIAARALGVLGRSYTI